MKPKSVEAFSSRVMMSCRKIFLLTWKNFLFRKRSWILTTCEIVLPTLLLLFLIFIKSFDDSTERENSERNYDKNEREREGEAKTFNSFTEEDLKWYLRLEGNILAYAPNNVEEIKEIMIKLNAGFGNKFVIIGYQNEMAIQNSVSKDTFGAIVFTEGLQYPLNFPKNHVISYKIRLKPSKYGLTDLHTTGRLFSSSKWNGPNEGFSKSYESFLVVQIVLDRILTQVLTSNPTYPKIIFQAFPYPSFIPNGERSSRYEREMESRLDFLFKITPMFIVMAFVFVVPSIILNIVSEKQTGIKELMKMMGLPNWMHWFGWMLNAMMIWLIIVIIITILLFVPFSQAGAIITSEIHWALFLCAFCLYAIAGIAFCFFISALFQIPILSTIVCIVLWITTYFAVSIPLEDMYESLSINEKMAAALLPNMALHWLFRILRIIYLKNRISPSSLNEHVDTFNTLTVGHVILMLIVDIILYMFLSIYLDNIIPSQYGVRKPWYYILKPPACMWQLWGKIRKKRKISVMPMPLNYAEEESPGFEAEEPNLTPGIIIRNLRKSFGRAKVAVNNISLKMFNGQITILLGHNGAGKTTAMSMLTGLIAPTSGTAVINGYDINTQMDHVRDSLGLCPQHNLLFDKLTVAEHLIFFGRVKGLTFAQAKTEMIALLGQLRLTEKRDVLSKALSGGQKRKLSLGIALIGGTKVLILDEPTSGMDPEARRAIWDILLEMRGLRTILLTTHFMEEADVLGDRIAIMADGKIKCCGSPIYLKRFYGAGYTLRMTLETNSDKDAILSIVQKRIPSALWKSEKLSNPSEIAITLPSGAESTLLFPSMFADLTENKKKTGILTLGLSRTTMDDVFIRVGELADEDEELEHKTDKPTDLKRKNVIPLGTESPDLVKAKRSCLYLQQFWALFVKKFLYTTRKRKLFIAQFLVPLLVLILTIFSSNEILSFPPNSEKPLPPPPPPLKMDLSHYKDAITLYCYKNEYKDYASNYVSLVGSKALLIGDGNYWDTLVRGLLLAGIENVANYRARYIVAADFGVENDDVIKIMFSTIPYHASPLAINLVSNAILRTIAPDKMYSIAVTNHPFKFEPEPEEIKARIQRDGITSVEMLFRALIPVSLAIFAASFVIFPIEEKLSQAKQLQLMTSVSPLIFWTSSLVWDFFVMIILTLLMLICFPIFEKYETFTTNSGLGVMFLILIVYGYTTILFSYLCSLFLKTGAGVTLAFFFWAMESILLRRPTIGSIITYCIFRLIASFFPTFGVTRCMLDYVKLSIGNSRCNDFLPEKYIKLICNSNSTEFSMMRICCPNCVSTNDTECFKPIPYLNWHRPQNVDFEFRRSTYGQYGGSNDDEPSYDEFYNYDYDEKFNITGIGQDLLYLFLFGICCHCLLLLIEFGFIRKIVDRIFKAKSFTFGLSVDEDVQAESERTHFLVETGNVSDEALVVHDLCKSYGSFAAVSNLNFTVHHGECFGLLGVNGAGKTTSFRMLTGDEIRSSGNAFMDKYTLEKNRKKFLSKLGYCPQFDGIIGVLTGREMLELFCRLRGVPGKSVVAEANKWLNKLGLYESGNVECIKYSGGMKRRLSAGMALVGDPKIILLDEPTSGVDPVSRRRFWNVLREVCESGVAVILTSHSMDECEALCSRLGIMVNGQLQCFGGVQHLKSKFVQGFSLLLKLNALISSYSPEFQFLKAEINEKFSPCALKDEHLNVLQYEVYRTPIPWAYVFQTMEDLKIRYVNTIEDFSVNETTLEQVFLSLAKIQYPPRVANVSCMKKFCTCQCC